MKRKHKAILLIFVLAAAISAGAGVSYAWFTATDSVTNRISAAADINVSLKEDFDPPEDWLPGTGVKKEISAVNTGNVDTFLKLRLKGVITISTKTTDSGIYRNADTSSAGVTYPAALDTTPGDYSTLSHDMVTNTVNTDYSRGYKTVTNIATDIHAIQADSQLICAAGVNLESPTADKNITHEITPDVLNYTPTAEGLYVFRRKKPDDTYTYGGYYYKGGVYYEISLIAQRARHVVGDDDMYWYEYEYQFYKNNEQQTPYNMRFSKVQSPDLHHNGQRFVRVSYEPENSDRQLSVRVYLAPDYDLLWQNLPEVHSGDTQAEFLYKKILRGGAGSSLLVTDMVLENENIVDFTSFNFKLQAELDSVQITKEADGSVSTAPAIQQWGYTATVNGDNLVWSKYN